MMKIFMLVGFLFLSAFPAMAQDAGSSQPLPAPREPVFFFAPLAEVSFYGEKKPSVGAGFSIASDGRVAIGMSAVYYHEVAKSNIGVRILAIEMLFFLRVYFLNRLCTGPFIQFGAGPIVLFEENDVKFPASSGAFSAGLLFGWRIPLGKIFYIEPAVRGGYPFIAGGGVSVGFRL